MPGDVDAAALYRELGQISAKLTDMSVDIVEIREQTTRTNGRVNKHDTQIASLMDLNAGPRLNTIEYQRAIEAGVGTQKRESGLQRWTIIGLALGAFSGSGLLLVRELVRALSGG